MGSDQVIGSRYRVTDTIGEGGMGDVYRGIDLQSGEIVAIKRLKPDIIKANPNLIERFARESEALRQLNHPNIVKMLAAVEENGRHYIVMQYVEGGSLRDLLDRERQLPVDRVVALGIELADALTRAHHLKIIHRDLKPENVLLDQDGTPLLTDFGVARIGTRSRMTEAGSVIGTYTYLSPEACMGGDLDARADLWSFGIMLYEMLAGKCPFESEQPTAILLAIMQNPLPDLRKSRPDTPPALVDLIERMLQKNRDQRIPSVRLVGAALEAIQDGENTPLSTTDLRDSATGSPRFAASTPVEAKSISVPAPAAAYLADEPIVITMPTPATAEAVVSPPAGRVKKWPWIVGGLAAAAVLTVVLLAVLGVFGGGKKDSQKTQAISRVDPVKPGEFMVLVAQMEPLQNVEKRDVSRFIVENLAEILEQDVPFSTLRIRAYPQVITSDQEAQAAAEANKATVVLWGNYTPDVIEVNVQIGVTSAFTHIAIPRDVLDRTANVRVHLTDERRESLAPQALSVVNVLYTADGNAYGNTRILAVLNEIHVTSGEIVSGGVSGYLQRGALVYFSDPAQAIQEYDAAIALDPGNPLVYGYRAAAYLRQGMFDQAPLDIETSRRLGPKDWTLPLYTEGMYANSQRDLQKGLETFDQIVALRPDDWFAVNYRGGIYYLMGKYDLAKADFDRALALNPDTNFPYILSILVALREGRLADIQRDVNTIITQFPDPTFSNRLIEAIFGDKIPNEFGPMFAAAGSLILGQYDQVIPEAEAALAIDSRLADMYLAEGVANCNLKNYSAAETAYTHGIEVEPDFIALYALRAEVRLDQKNTTGALEDGQVVQQSRLSSAFMPLVQAGMKGEWDCTKFFNFDYSALGTGNAQ